LRKILDDPYITDKW